MLKLRNKPRLELALYARPKFPGTYRYALFVTPKSDKPAREATVATKHHVKNTLQNVSGQASQPWRYERAAVSDFRSEHRLLVRVIIAKITSIERLERTLEALPIYQKDDPDQTKAESFNCVSWVRAAVEGLVKADALARPRDWDSIQKRSLIYVEEKKGMGRWESSQTAESGIPLLDYLAGTDVEIVT